MKNNYIKNPLTKEEKTFLFSASRKAKKGYMLNPATRKNIYLAGKQEKWFIGNISYFFNSICSYALFYSKDKPSNTYKILIKIFELLTQKEKSVDKDVLYQCGKIYADFFLKTEDLITYTDKDDKFQTNMYYHLSNYLWSGKAEKKYFSEFPSSRYITQPIGIDEKKEITPLMIRALDCYEKASNKGHYLAKKAFCTQYFLYFGRIASNKTFKKVLKTLTELTKSGDSEAQCALGDILIDPEIYGGKKTDINKKRAIELWQEAEKKFSGEAFFNLGRAHYFGINTLKENKEKGMQLLLASANSKDIKSSITGWDPYETKYELARIFSRNEQMDSKYEYWLKRTIEGDNKVINSLAYEELGNFYYNKNTENNYKKAKSMFHKASTLGNHEATVSLGDLYRFGLGLKINIKKAILYYLVAKELSMNTDALVALGEIYFNGEGVNKSYSKAKEFFQDAAEYGESSDAINYLGYIYQYGYSVKKNISKAKKLYKDAINEHNEKAYINLARIYMYEENFKEGIKLYKQAIKDFDSGYANLYLGKSYCYGWGVEINNHTALKYFLQAEKLGIKEAKEEIVELDNEYKDDQFKDINYDIKKIIDNIAANNKEKIIRDSSSFVKNKTFNKDTKKNHNTNYPDNDISQLSINEMKNMDFQDPSEIEELILREESKFLEFKASLRTPYPDKDNQANPNYNTIRKSLEVVSLKSICGFLNKDGGILVIGVHEKDTNKVILGIEREFDSKNSKIKSRDSYQLHFHNIIEQQIGKKFVDYIDIDIISHKNKLICIVKITKLPSGEHAWLENKFFIRVGNSTRERTGTDLEFILKHRNKK